MAQYSREKEEKFKQHCTFEPKIIEKREINSKYWELNQDIIQSKKTYGEYVHQYPKDSFKDTPTTTDTSSMKLKENQSTKQKKLDQI